MHKFFLKVISAVIAAVLVVGLFPGAAKTSAENTIEEAVSNMSTEEKLCQMLVLSFGYAQDADGNQFLPSSVASLIKKYCLGGVILFAQNCEGVEGTVRYIDSLQTANALGGSSRPQLLICTDQEGGTITRLGYGTQMPGNMALGADPDPGDAFIAGRIIGSELNSLGISVDFAPVVDVNSNPANPVIGVRSFSDSAEIAGERGRQFVSGLMSTGTIASLKHFPGHGDTSTDSHTGLPLIEKTYAELEDCELLPFGECIEQGAEMIMTAHIQFPNIETGRYVSRKTGREVCLPATLSKTIVTDILRNDLGFDGVVITDSMTMDALSEHFDKYDSAKLAIEAGVDMLLMPVNPIGSAGAAALENYIAKLVWMAENGELSMDRIDAAVTRILRLKQRHGLTAPYDGSNIESRIASASAVVGSTDNHAAEWAIAKKCITLLKNEDELIPLIRENEKTVILAKDESERFSVQYAVDLIRTEGMLAKGAEIRVLDYTDNSLDAIFGELRGTDNVIIISELRSESALRGSTARKIDSIISFVHSNGGKVILLSALLPYDAARFRSADAIMLAYSSRGMNEDPRKTDGTSLQYGPNIPAAVYLMFSSGETPSGILPVNIPALGSDNRFTGEVLYPRGASLRYDIQIDPTPAPTETPVPSETTLPTEAVSLTPTSPAFPLPTQATASEQPKEASTADKSSVDPRVIITAALIFVIITSGITAVIITKRRKR